MTPNERFLLIAQMVESEDAQVINVEERCDFGQLTEMKFAVVFRSTALHGDNAQSSKFVSREEVGRLQAQEADHLLAKLRERYEAVLAQANSKILDQSRLIVELEAELARSIDGS